MWRRINPNGPDSSVMIVPFKHLIWDSIPDVNKFKKNLKSRHQAAVDR